MDWGLTYPAHIHSWEWVSYGEPKGFSAYMPYDTQCIGSDIYETLALCAVHTRTMRLGPGVTNPRSRIAPVTAGAMATLNELAPGRVVLGISTGNTARRTLGMPAARLQEVREHVETCRPNQVMIQPILDPKATIDSFHEHIMSRYSPVTAT